MPPRNPGLGLLSLPPELRLRIYEYLLIKREISLTRRRSANEPALTPALLRTCRLIHREATPVLYTRNTLLLNIPGSCLRTLQSMGAENVRSLRSLRLSVWDPFEAQAWYKLLGLLAREATGLRKLDVYWDSHPIYPDLFAKPGSDVQFVRLLGRIQGVKDMEISGFYAMHWPRYLEEKMGVKVAEEFHARAMSFQQMTEGLVP